MENISKKTIEKENFRINREKFMASDEREILRKKQPSKKYNIKIKKSDLILLDAMAETNEVPRSTLLNEILHEILLKSLEEEIKDKDTKILIASEADKLVKYDHTDIPWIFDALPIECHKLIQNIIKFNQAQVDVQPDMYAPADANFNSESYNLIQKALKENKK